MPNCFTCGKPLKPGSRTLRRKVRTGEWERRGRAATTPGSRNVHYGYRVVCPFCARRIDGESLRREALQYVELGVAVLLLLAAMVARALR